MTQKLSLPHQIFITIFHISVPCRVLSHNYPLDRIILWSIAKWISLRVSNLLHFKLPFFFSHTTSRNFTLLSAKLGCAHSQINRDFHYWMQINRGVEKYWKLICLFWWISSYSRKQWDHFEWRSLTHFHIRL